ncbi:MAG: hypothetical protein UX09_C0026G0007 [Candidatus Uhrbacteria bacterium GW2011_GWE2_45_35]|uniref:Uncharacterized protein n=2 Tax=Candidatus Uhriibacteriota TaxID=1752732 RepID=A0A0G1MI29_9BACT|nr:MAG: hypothetical protein UW63_C0012G0008 [Candidatus Uhrbacteria bacterium GW2011_GWF2_44_350]KKU07656.1 MAG: hypothetical protein UX09_C0026G0007 [Candidatus Uhrbacteria bacterium GW2011_GWE2_45_35]HBR80067.1 hypothetical protein [Candidatus Uhrbacteria bacterium]HCU31239.1 hypothetical protein [Candidatus Uhrbacteria bacterium]
MGEKGPVTPEEAGVYLKKGVGGRRVKKGEEPSEELVAKAIKEITRRRTKNENRDSGLGFEKGRDHALDLLTYSLDNQSQEEISQRVLESARWDLEGTRAILEQRRERVIGLIQEHEKWLPIFDFLNNLEKRYDKGGEPGLGRGKKKPFRVFLDEEINKATRAGEQVVDLFQDKEVTVFLHKIKKTSDFRAEIERRSLSSERLDKLRKRLDFVYQELEKLQKKEQLDKDAEELEKVEFEQGIN